MHPLAKATAAHYVAIGLVMLLCTACHTAGSNTEKQGQASGLALVVDQQGVARKINPKQKAVYLVFTAHYSSADSGRFENFDGVVPVLDILKQKGVKGSFFPTGVCFDQPKYKAAIKRIVADGHYLSAHSYAHLLMSEGGKSLVTTDSIDKDIKLMEQKLNEVGLKKSQYCWMIPPYETYNQENVDELHRLGYHLISPTAGINTDMDWTAPGDKNYTSAHDIMQTLWRYEAQHGMNGVILLVHAMNYPGRTVSDRVYTHLGEIIDGLRARGYTFKTMTDVIAASKAGKTTYQQINSSTETDHVK